jgi:UDP-N-acetylmuramoyl-tripeptide--D-alanyl-D-alanine ligase
LRPPGKWTLEELAFASGGRLVLGDPRAVARGVCTDSRTVRKGQVFIALKGERFDGHDFARGADLARAAVAVVNESRFTHVARQAWTLPLVVVQDTGEALLGLAARTRAASDIEWTGITGSAGKTTTKELTAACLGALGPVLKAPASFNNRVGVPLTILGLRQEHRAAVLELGTGGPGEMRELARTARPDVGVVTAIGPAHLERFGTLEAVAREKAGMLRAIPEDGVAVLPRACPHYAILRKAAKCLVTTYGLERGLDFSARDVEIRTDGTSRFTVHGARVTLNLAGRVNVLNALAAIAAADALGVSPEDSAERLAGVKPFALRGRVREGGGLRVIEDCYNANPMSFAASLEALALVRGASRAWVVAGDMKELGEASARYHEELGDAIACSGAVMVLAVGDHAESVVRGARRAGLRRGATEAVATASEGADRAREIAREGDVVLVKGSRAVGLEVVVEALLGSRSEDGIAA